MKLTQAMLAALLFATAPAALAHGAAVHGKKPARKAAQPVEEKSFGQPGDAKEAVQTIHIDMRDEMEYLPNGLRLKAGDTVVMISGSTKLRGADYIMKIHDLGK